MRPYVWGIVRLVIIAALIVNGCVNALFTLAPAGIVSAASFLGLVLGGTWLGMIVGGDRGGDTCA